MPTEHPNRFLQFQPLVVLRFRREISERLLQLKYPDAITLAGCCQRILTFLFRNRLQCLVKFSTGMGAAAYYPDVLRQLVVALVPVCV